MAQSSSLVSISSVFIFSNGNSSDSNVIMGENSSLGVGANFFIDPSLSGKGARFDINFQIVQVGGQIVASNNWYSQLQGEHYPLLLDSVVPGGGDYAVGFGAKHASDVNVHGGVGNLAEEHNQGMYLVRAYLFVDTDKYASFSEGTLAQAQGAAQFAISDDLCFWCN